MSDFSLVLACHSCDTPGIVFGHSDEREVAVHDHDTAPFAVRTEHPDRIESDTTSFPTGATVTFWGSTAGKVTDYVLATVEREADNVTSDGDPVKGVRRDGAGLAPLRTRDRTFTVFTWGFVRARRRA